MAKKFKNTKVGKILTGGFFKTVIKSVPIVGDLASNVLDENGTKAGEVNKKELPVTLIRLGILVVILYLALSGKIEWTEAEQAKDLIGE